MILSPQKKVVSDKKARQLKIIGVRKYYLTNIKVFNVASSLLFLKSVVF